MRKEKREGQLLFFFILLFFFFNYILNSEHRAGLIFDILARGAREETTVCLGDVIQ